ncbi:MAG: hypothetical protein ABFD90_18860 [Phycisphaerales bacterium]
MSYLFGNSQHEPSRRLRGLLQDCARFSEFVDLNRRKIRKKIRCAPREELGDVLAELRVACLLLSDHRVDLEYEKYDAKVRSVDFCATFENSIHFDVEVARIRAGEIVAQYAKWYRDLRDSVGVESTTVQWHIRLDDIEASLRLIEELRQSLERTGQFVHKKVREEAATLSYRCTAEYPVEGFENRLTLVLFTDPLVVEPNAGCYSYVRSIPYKQDEYLKFRDIVIDKLGQLRAGMINVIYVLCEDERYNPADLPWGMESLIAALRERDVKVNKKILKRFRGIEEFIAQFGELSAVVCRCDEGVNGKPNVLWSNPHARNPVPEAVSECLSQIDHPLA